jgi:hypothetical protein
MPGRPAQSKSFPEIRHGFLHFAAHPEMTLIFEF